MMQQDRQPCARAVKGERNSGARPTTTVVFMCLQAGQDAEQ